MANTFDFTLDTAKLATVTPNRSYISVSVEDVEKSEVLNLFDLDDVVDHFDDVKILEHIGKDRVKEFYDLIDNPE